MRVHFFHRWGEQQVAAGIQQALLIGFQGARVAGEVFVDAELQRIDEDAGHHEVDALTGFFHQGGVAVMQVAHGWDETNALAFATGAGHCGAQLAHRSNCIHAENPCSAAGKLTPLTALT